MGYTVVEDGKRRCINCNQLKAVEEFYSYPYKTRQGKQSIRSESRCKSCGRARRKAHYWQNTAQSQATAVRYKRANRDAVNAQVKAHREANRSASLAIRRASQAKRRAQQVATANGAVYQRVIEEARFGDKYLDAYSGELIDVPTVDHIQALSKGGAHDYWNLCVTSHASNSQKQTRSLLIWLLVR